MQNDEAFSGHKNRVHETSDQNQKPKSASFFAIENGGENKTGPGAEP